MSLSQTIRDRWSRFRESKLFWWVVSALLLMLVILAYSSMKSGEKEATMSPHEDKETAHQEQNAPSISHHVPTEEPTASVEPTGVWGMCLKSHARVPVWYENMEKLRAHGALFLSKASSHQNQKVCGQPAFVPVDGGSIEHATMPERKYYENMHDLKMDGAYFIGWGPCRQIIGPIPPSTHKPLQDNPILHYLRVYKKKGPWFFFHGHDVARTKHWIRNAYPSDSIDLVSSVRLPHELTKATGGEGDILLVTKTGDEHEPILFACRRGRAAQMLKGTCGMSMLDKP